MVTIFLLHAIYGATFTISKILVQYAQPMFAVGIRMMLAGFILLGLGRIFEKQRFSYTASSVLCVVQLAFFGIFLPYTMRYWSLKYLTVAKISLIYNLGPFVSCILAYFLLHERLSIFKFLGMGIGFLSVIPLFMFCDPAECGMRSFFGVSMPEIVMFLSVSSWCYSWVIMKKFPQSHDMFFGLNGRSMLLGGIFATIVAYGSGEACTISQPEIFFPWLMLIIFMTNIVCFRLYSYLMKHHSVTLISLGSLFAPISASFTSWLYFGEVINIGMIFSAVLVSVGFVIFYWDELRHLSDRRSR